MVLQSRQAAHRLSTENKKQSDIWQRQRRSLGGKSQSVSAELMGSQYRDASLSPYRERDYNGRKQEVGDGFGYGRFWCEIACGKGIVVVSLQIVWEMLKVENLNAVDVPINIAGGWCFCGQVVTALTRWAIWCFKFRCDLHSFLILIPIISCYFWSVSIN